MSWILIFLLLWGYVHLGGRISKLEARLLQADRVPPAPASVPVASSVPPSAPPVPLPERDDVFRRLGQWMKDEWMMKLGALLLLIGVGWFLRYAFMENWIGPMGRVTLGLCVGVVVLMLGYRRAQKEVTQGAVLLMIGAGILHMTIFSARFFYDMFHPAVALGLLFGVSAFVTVAAVMMRTQSLAIATVLLAGVAPILAHSGTTDYVGLFAYLSVVVVGVLSVVWRTSWYTLYVVTLVMLVVYSLPSWFWWSTDRNILVLYAYLHTALFITVPLLQVVKSRMCGNATMQTMVLSSLYLVMWVMVGANESWQPVILSVWATVYAVAAHVAYRATSDKHITLINSAIGALLLATATAILLEGPALTIAFLLEGTCMVLAYVYMTKQAPLTLILVLLPGLNGVLSAAYDYLTPVDREEIFHGEFAVLLIAWSMLFGLVYLLRRAFLVSRDHILLFVLAISGTVIFLVHVWLFLHDVLPEHTATFASLGLYAVLGVALSLFGMKEPSRKLIERIGQVMIGVVTLRLLIIDVWNLDLFFRVVTFVSIGLFFILVAYFRKRTTQKTSSL
jgi:uncharacterized membrane protein